MPIVDNLAELDSAPDHVPVEKLCCGSLFYPAARFDGSAVRIMGRRGIHSFVYADYGVTEDELGSDLALRPFHGYELRWQRELTQRDLVPHGWRPALMPTAEDGRQDRAMIRTGGFANWYLFKRAPEFGDSHGPAAFSLLYVGGDGAATFQALYWQRAVPDCIAIIQPGTGFGGNWTDFRERGKILYRSVMENPSGQPKRLLYGGFGIGPEDYSQPCWPEFDRRIGQFNEAEHGRHATLWERSQLQS